MGRRRLSDYNTDSKRLAENIRQHARRTGFKIVDRNTYDMAYDKYLADSPSARLNKELRDDSFKFVSGRDSSISKERLVAVQKVPTKKARIFTVSGKQRGRIVNARRINTKSGIRYIDKKGRYVSIKR